MDEGLCFRGLWLMLVIELVSKWEICWALRSLVLFDSVQRPNPTRIMLRGF